LKSEAPPIAKRNGAMGVAFGCVQASMLGRRFGFELAKHYKVFTIF